jgi:hypothetical protein
VNLSPFPPGKDTVFLCIIEEKDPSSQIGGIGDYEYIKKNGYKKKGRA